MNILDEIILEKRREVMENKILVPVKVLENSKYFCRATNSLSSAVLNKSKRGIIAEIKRKSPSKGIINHNVSIAEIAKGYARAEASAISVLTDSKYFGGSNNDLMNAREVVTIPLLRKDFIVDEYQIVEAKAIGADAILLIAAALPVSDLVRLSNFAKSIHLEVLLEVHNEDELSVALNVPCNLIGVNNRNLKTFEVSVDISRNLISKIPQSISAVSESGIESKAVIEELSSLGYSGFLIGQYFMQTDNPALTCQSFIQSLSC